MWGRRAEGHERWAGTRLEGQAGPDHEQPRGHGFGPLKSPGKVLIDGVSRKKTELPRELSGCSAPKGLQAKVCNCSLQRLKGGFRGRM